MRAACPIIAQEALRHPFQATLDIGCGTGGLLGVVHEQRRAATLFGLDLSDEMRAVQFKAGQMGATRFALGVSAR